MSISFYEKNNVFKLQTNNSTYAFCIDTDKNLGHLYWGAKIEEIEDLPTLEQLSKRYSIRGIPLNDVQEYRGFGGYSFTEPALKVRFYDGTRNLFLKYQSHKVVDDTKLYIKLKDTKYPIEVTLIYSVHTEYDIIERSSTIQNQGTDDIILEQAFSATWRLPHRDDFRLTYLPGFWAGEYQIKHESIINGQRVLETRTGLSGPEAVPFFMIDEKGLSNEENGGVYFGSLAWSGNWKMVIDKDKAHRVIITGGVNNFDFECCLTAGKTFDTPVFCAGYTEGGFGQVSRNMHDYERNVIMHPVEKYRIMPTLYNAYGTFFTGINEERIIGVIDTAYDLGIELLVVDAGWQGYGDADSLDFRKGMGIWNVNKDRFPNGLKPIADKLHQKGMMFGLWMEPECVHPESELLVGHPDWIFKYENREAEILDGFYILNFANEEVCEYITNKICELIEENGVDYFKIDFNRFVPHMGWQGVEQKHQKDVWVRYVENIYKCYGSVKERFPNIMFENCASGGMRMDLGMLKFSGRLNRSDNQDTLDMVKIHEGFSYFMLPKLAGGGCHISDIYSKYFNDRTSTMKYQAHVSMLGSLAIGKDLTKISEEETKELKEYIKLYKEIRHIVHLGDIYRLVSPREKSYAAFEYLSKDKKEVVVFLLGQSMQFCQMPERLKLQGLMPDRKYNVEGYGVFTGNGLMRVGLPIFINGDMKSEIIKIRTIVK